MATKLENILFCNSLHARASMKLINLAGRFQSQIFIHYQDHQADAKDILDVMGLGAAMGSEIELIIDGPDKNQAMTKITELIEHRFDEEK